ncbi:MAG: hypothetical protein QOD06_1977 [Candidatus Binatota bacterium]|nr:hypothetical protein [Candidatus Binatota bacterium]
MSSSRPTDLTALRAAAAEPGRAWRSLDELAGGEEMRELLEREFPAAAAEWIDAVSRRRFLELMGASLALAGLGGCTKQPEEKIVPYVQPAEDVVPGKPLFFASAFTLSGVATGVLVESHMGRPTKIEGNPSHPSSLGGTDPFTQASVLGFWDPDRAQTLTYLGRIRPWSAFVESIGASIAAQGAKRGGGLRVLTETVTSPTLARQLRELLEKYPAAKWHQYEPAGQNGARVGSRLAFGEFVDTQYRIPAARVLLSIDADFLACGPASLRYSRDFAAARRVEAGRAEMNRLYVVEPSPTNTGAMADHRLALRPSEVEAFTRLLASRLGVPIDAGDAAARLKAHERWIDVVTRDLQASRGASLVIAGETQPPAVHALAHAMNHYLENVGRTVVHTEPIEANPTDQLASIAELAGDMEAGRVDLLVIVGANPVFHAPADLEFAKRMQKVPVRVQLSLSDDETTPLCHWHVPEAHPLEAWSDARSFDGTATVLQPLIAPLYEGKSAHEVIAALAGDARASGYELVRETWRAQAPAGEEFDAFWRRSVHDGVVAGTALGPKAVSLRSGEFHRYAAAAAPRAESAGSLEVALRTDPTIYDGRFANNSWLQELPKPITQLTWDNAVLVGPETADRLGVTAGDVVELRAGGRSVEGPVWVLPGQAAGSATIHYGYGRRRSGRVGTGAGFDPLPLRTTQAQTFVSGVEVRKTERRYELACAQGHWSMEGRPLARSGTLGEFRENPDFAKHQGPPAPDRDLTLYPNYEYRGYAWGMAIDLNACVGCNACVVACQAENNIPVVGKEQVLRGREMHWIRLDRYFEGELDRPRVLFQPVPCMHCENAPCEPVCPVGATVHSHEGLNDMVYNRCVGTRYCQNNCPYKVRRFNFLLYSDWTTDSVKGVRNPDVTVRSRGVMEKCTYCVQRINAGKIQSEKEDRRVVDGEIRTACQQACPADAITFGDVNDRESRVAQLKGDPREYAILAELNTRPRTTYLARLRNPHPELAAIEGAGRTGEPARGERSRG